MAEFLTITLIIILAAISPGPDFAVVVKNSLQHNRLSGIFTALGVSCSLLVHTTYCILGLAVIIAQSLLLFNLIKYLGAAYLIFIGVKSLLAKRKLIPKIHEQIPHGTLSMAKSFTEGLLCNLLNPKAIMFILAFFSLVVKPSTSMLLQFALSIEISLIHFVWFSWLAVMITHHRIKESLNKIEFYIVKIMGLVLIVFGTHIAFLHHNIG